MSKSLCKRCGGEADFPLDTCQECLKYESEVWGRGYAAAVADICAGLRTGRTKGGEVITTARHAVEVIERGDFVAFATKKEE